jgi:hypothetical protein
VFKLQQSIDIITNGSGVYNSNYSLFKPSHGVDNSSSYPYNDWANLINLYQNFNTIKIKLQYIPKIGNDTSLQTFFLPFYISKDLDDSQTDYLTSVDDAISYPGVKIKNLFKPWTETFEIKNTVLNTNDNVVMMNGKIFYRTDTGSFKGVLKTYAEGLDSSTTYGTLNMSIFVNCRNRN